MMELTLDAVHVAQIDIPRNTLGTVPGTVPEVVSMVTRKGSRKATLTPVSGRVCGAKPTATWQSIPKA
jgi:hypothetical protein